ncbi:MAG TPA: sensor histidine kinase KdpD [Rickettsiales bacterium]|nr:sensor histidine kinase KdpD [Rickettsiales bacterium]
MNERENRPDPEQLLRKIKAEERSAVRGKLKIFFGGCAGVGKTYAMLASGHQLLLDGVDIVAGVVETHGRAETLKLLEGMPVIPQKELSYRGMTVKEFDIDAALDRKPAILLLDELAHTNAPGSRHAKRWNDVEELLAAGIDVYTTLNVQHLESLNDMVAGTTGVWVKETVPDSVFDNAEDVVLVDINADELLKRLSEGKVYINEQARTRAAEHFFKKSNLIALRELALRRTTERVDAQMDAYKIREGIRGLQPVADKLLVCVGPDPLSETLVRSAKRIAAAFKAPWTAGYVENARHYQLGDEQKKVLESHLRMAERLGGKTVVLQGTNALDEIMAYARDNGITKIVIGKHNKPRWREIVFGTLADKVIRKSGSIDVYVITGDMPEHSLQERANELVQFKPALYLQAMLIIALCTLAGVGARGFIKPIDEVLIYLAGNVVVSARLGRGPSVMYALLSAACLNFFFIEPLYTLQIYDRSYWMTLTVMLATSLVINSYASRLRLQALFARKRERHSQMFYAFTREMAATRGHVALSEVAARHIRDSIGAEIVVCLPGPDDILMPVWGSLPQRDVIKENSLVQWCFSNSRPAGLGTDTMSSADAFYAPLVTADSTVGVLGVIPRKSTARFSPEERSLIETFANLLASGVERANAAETAERLRVDAEGEKLRNTLLSSVSHDLRTPLASITGSSGIIATDASRLSSDQLRELGASINQEATRLSRIVTNMLDVTRLESANFQLNKQPYFIEELIGSVLVRLAPQLAQHDVQTHAAPDLPVGEMDGVLIEQVLTNLLENATKYTQPGSIICIEVSGTSSQLHICVSDNGPGIPAGEEKRIFDKFYTANRGEVAKGSGLGLAVCHTIITAHGGSIWAENRPEGGAAFHFTLPVAV